MKPTLTLLLALVLASCGRQGIDGIKGNYVLTAVVPDSNNNDASFAAVGLMAAKVLPAGVSITGDSLRIWQSKRKIDEAFAYTTDAAKNEITLIGDQGVFSGNYNQSGDTLTISVVDCAYILLRTRK